MNLIFLFSLYLLMFSFIGILRGWAKELLLTFSLLTGLALILLLYKYIPLVRSLPQDSSSLLWIRMIILIAMLYFGYRIVIEIPTFDSRAHSVERSSKPIERRRRFFGFLVGLLNGYLFTGTSFFYINATGYLLLLIGYSNDDTTTQMLQRLLIYMPPVVLGEPWIYFAVIIGLVIVIYFFI